MREYEGHPSVLIGDVDCTKEESVCSNNGVSGYPTIMFWTDGAGKDGGEKYQGGRDADALKRHVEENLLPKCDATDPENTGCDDQEIAYIAKQAAKPADARTKELARLDAMKGATMKPDKKAWIQKRIRILQKL